MKEIYFTSKVIDSNELKLDYFLLSDTIELGSGSILCENYGAKITASKSDRSYSKAFENVTASYQEIMGLMHKLSRNEVTPVAFGDVLSDWLGT